MESLFETLMEWALFLFGVLLYLLIRCVILIIRVCIFYRCKALWISLGIFLATIVLSGLVILVSIHAAGIAAVLVPVGFIQLTITAKVVEIRHADTFMKEPEALIGSVLHTNWFSLH